MANSDSPLDIAISFLSADLGTAQALRDGLSPLLDVFVYTHRQEDVAGTDGLDSFRHVFRTRARLVVILFRAGWGQSRWTRVEEQAITDRFLEEGPGFLFVIMMDSASAPPPWLPDKLIRFALADFGIEQAVGAIKARASERGSVYHKETLASRALRSQELAEFERERERLLRSEAGVAAAVAEYSNLSAAVTSRMAEVQSAAPGLSIEFGSTVNWFAARTGRVSIHGGFRNRYTNVLEGTQFVLKEINGSSLLPGQDGYYITQPKVVKESQFVPYLNREGWGWQDQKGAFHSSAAVAHFCVDSFLSLIDRASAGQLPDLDW